MFSIDTVDDWDKRIEDYPEDVKQFYKKMVPKIAELKGMNSTDNQGWSTLVNDKKLDVHIFSKKSEAGFMTMKAYGHINHNVLDIWRCIQYNPWRPEWDANCAEIFWIEKMGVAAYTMYNRSKKVMVVSGRDFIMDVLTFQEPDGTILLIISSNEEQTLSYPQKKGVVRANAPIGGWVLIPDKDDPNKTHCSLSVEIDMVGYFPDIAINTAFRQQGYQINELRKTIPKYLEKFKHQF